MTSSAALGSYDYVFSENGLVAHKDGEQIGNQVSTVAACTTSCMDQLEAISEGSRIACPTLLAYRLPEASCVSLLAALRPVQSLKTFLGEEKLKVRMG